MNKSGQRGPGNRLPHNVRSRANGLSSQSQRDVGGAHAGRETQTLRHRPVGPEASAPDWTPGAIRLPATADPTPPDPLRERKRPLNAALVAGRKENILDVNAAKWDSKSPLVSHRRPGPQSPARRAGPWRRRPRGRPAGPRHCPLRPRGAVRPADSETKAVCPQRQPRLPTPPARTPTGRPQGGSPASV